MKGNPPAPNTGQEEIRNTKASEFRIRNAVKAAEFFED